MEWLEQDAEALDAASALDPLMDEAAEEDETVADGVSGSFAPSPHLPVARPGSGTGWPALEPAPRLALTPRTYQEDALAAWTAAGGRGVVVLPTGAGKTMLALMAV